jgi:hypothetical protein
LIVSATVPVFSMVKYCVAAMTRPKEIARGVTTTLLKLAVVLASVSICGAAAAAIASARAIVVAKPNENRFRRFIFPPIVKAERQTQISEISTDILFITTQMSRR